MGTANNQWVRGQAGDVLAIDNINLDALYTFIAKNVDSSGNLTLPSNLNVTGNIVATGSISGGTLIDTPPITANGALGYTGDLFRAQINSVDVWEVDDTGLAQSAGVDALVAGAFTIGATTATSVVVTPATTFSGALTVNGASVTGGASLASVNLSAGNTSLNLGTGAITSGAITAPSISGSAATLTTARTINGVSFNGSANITVTAAAGTLTGTTLNATVVTSSLTAVGILASPHMTGPTVDSGGMTITSGGMTVTSGGLTVSAGPSTITGDLTISPATAGGGASVAWASNALTSINFRNSTTGISAITALTLLNDGTTYDLSLGLASSNNSSTGLGGNAGFLGNTIHSALPKFFLAVGGLYLSNLANNAAQTATALWAGTGAPSNSNGSNGDYYLRSDGGAVTHLYFKAAGTWAGLV